MRDVSWMDQAACRGMDTELFFADAPTAREIARAACHRCPVKPECLQYALDNRIDFGVWGGESKYQRTRRRGVPRQRVTDGPTGQAAINAKKTHCKNSHPFDEENTGWNGKKRFCRKCQRDRIHARREAQRQQGAETLRRLLTRREARA